MYPICRIQNISGEAKTLYGKVFEIDEIYAIPDASRLGWATRDSVLQAIVLGDFDILDSTQQLPTISEKIDYLKMNILNNTPTPFANKSQHNFRGTGQQYTLAVGNNTLNFSVPTGEFDINGIATIGGELLDYVQFKILDDASGTYSGIPNFELNQFAYDWNVTPIECKSLLPYPARLKTGMVINITYYSMSIKTIGVNYFLHKVVA